MYRLRFAACTVSGIGLAAMLALAGCATAPRSPGPAAARAAAAAALAGGAAASGGSSSVPASYAGAEVGATGVPDWVVSYPTDPRYFIGVGGAPDSGNRSADMEAAQKAARNALAQEIATTVQSETSLAAHANQTGSTTQSVTVLINERVNLTLNGVELVASYHSKKLGYWFYYRLARDALDPRPAIARAVADLVRQIPAPATLSLGAITYSDSGMSSPLSLYLQDQLLLALRSHKGITVSAKRPARGLKGSGASTRDLLLSGTFFGSAGGAVSVFLRLTDPRLDTIAAESTFTLDAAMLPAALSVAPVNYATALAAKKAVVSVGVEQASSLHIRLWTQRGPAATYLDGEDLVVDFTTNRDCYIKMYHIDVFGRVSLILPNQYSSDNYFRAGQIYQIPPRSAPYQFLLGKPYGVEFIKVIASTSQFSQFEPSFTDLGEASRGLLERGLSVAGANPSDLSDGGGPSGWGTIDPAGQTSSPAPETAQAMISYTILGRGE